jgi:general secretion pathway protein G
VSDPAGQAGGVPARRRRRRATAASRRAWRGFTLIELLVVLAIIATLLSISAPRFLTSFDRAREAALRENLFIVRGAIDKYVGDTGRYPERLEDLVSRRYLRSLPVDPLTDSADTWTLVPPPAGAAPGQVYDLRSGAPGQAADGSAYADW